MSYIISAGNEEGRFSVGYDSGMVSLVRPMLRPAELDITASDHGFPPRKSVFKLSLTLASDETDGPPRLLLPNQVAKISEDFQVGASVINVAGPAAASQGKDLEKLTTNAN